MTPEADDGSSSPEDLEVSKTTDPRDNRLDRAEVNMQANNGQSTATTNAKDPLRPRRKKARRACFACQRAHLTCGDERPCQRCIKRGLQDACHDGVRKKAKYLHDAPNEALMPGIGGNSFNHMTRSRNATKLSDSIPASTTSSGFNQQQAFLSQTQPVSSGYGMYPQSSSQGPMPPPMQDGSMQFASQQSSISPTIHSRMNQQTSQMHGLPVSMPQVSMVQPAQGQNIYGGPVFDPNDPSMFNFDLASLNFGNHYGALEFGMLGHMSSGAAETPPGENGNSNPMLQTQANMMNASFPTPQDTPSAYTDSPINSATYPYTQEPLMSDWQRPRDTTSRRESYGNIYGNNTGLTSPPSQVSSQTIPNAFAIGAGTSTLTSPSSADSPQGAKSGFESGSMNTTFHPNTTLGSQQVRPQNRKTQQHQHQNQQKANVKPPSSNTQPPSVLGKRTRDPSAIYDTVKQPYSYTTGFHGLTAFLQRRFSAAKTLRIAKSLASIRPSFISCTKSLNRDDLIFMEKCFQRTLWEYEDFINACGTPTIVCRRTGEVAAVGKEFSILTGWKKDVLLGKEANLNVNTGGTAGHATSTGASSRGGMNTPRHPDGAKVEEGGNSRPQPVFLAELLDDESVIAFYEDFARLAFGDSRGSVTTRCKLLKYKTKEDRALPAVTDEVNIKMEDGEGDANVGMKRQKSAPQQQQLKQRNYGKTAAGAVSKGGGDISGEAGMNQLGIRDGKVDCTYCWTVKRDVFDIPMLIVMNVSPYFSGAASIAYVASRTSLTYELSVSTLHLRPNGNTVMTWSNEA
ncbi:MAG: Transcriptional regulator of nonfermentable carbon utilization [Candelina submexicana]|nr:MAG: Transcriptional regulator of nonfermentable carbon utilization [Candelina submexicana]